MKLFNIPLFSNKTARWKSSIDLGDSRYTLYFSWNTRMRYWEMSMYDSSKVLIVGGIRLVTLIDLLQLYKPLYPKLPKGELILLAKTKNVIEITRDNLANDFALTYTEM